MQYKIHSLNLSWKCLCHFLLSKSVSWMRISQRWCLVLLSLLSTFFLWLLSWWQIDIMVLLSQRWHGDKVVILWWDWILESLHLCWNNAAYIYFLGRGMVVKFMIPLFCEFGRLKWSQFHKKSRVSKNQTRKFVTESTQPETLDDVILLWLKSVIIMWHLLAATKIYIYFCLLATVISV